jgi:hypothetical protein
MGRGVRTVGKETPTHHGGTDSMRMGGQISWQGEERGAGLGWVGLGWVGLGWVGLGWVQGGGS